MTHTFKSLLITTVLTLPSVFASDDALNETGSDAQPTDDHRQSSLQTYELLHGIFLPNDIASIITGYTPMTLSIGQYNRHHRGYLDLQDLAALALTSKTLNALAQPVLDAAKLWGLDLPLRILLQMHNSLDTEMLKLFSISFDLTFDNLLNLAFDLRFPMTKTTLETHTELVNKINSTATFTDVQKRILRGLLPNATPGDMRLAANALRDLGAPYRDRAATEYSTGSKCIA